MALVEELEEAWEKPFVVESDKAWDAIHRCLTDGSLLYDSGEYPLNHYICGGRQLHRGRDYTVSYDTARQVKDVAGALRANAPRSCYFPRICVARTSIDNGVSQRKS